MNGIVREGNSFCLSLDTAVYHMEAIKKAAYRFADRASVIISPTSGSKVSVMFNFVGKHADANPDEVISDFCNELLDQDLRETIKAEAGPLRNLILAHAFSRSSLVDQKES